MSRQRVIPVAAAVAVLTVVLAACSGNSPEAPSPTAGTASPAPATATASPEPSTAPSPSPSEQTLSGTGTYVGQIDNHSVEIETEEGATAFELGAGTEAALEALEENDSVVFEYVEKAVAGDPAVTQKILTRLAKADASAGAGTGGSDLPQTRQLKLSLEGMQEEKTAALAEADGYALYVFDIFTFDPDTGTLAMKAFPDYYATITRLPGDFNLDMLKQEGTELLSKTGKVTEMSEEQRTSYLSGARLFLTGLGDKLSRQYIVKELDGRGYIVQLNIPQGEASEGFAPHVYASLDSLVNL